ncbi:RNA-binding S4 domain-containing protein [Mycoplasmatota bacterium]|nr:RNA-binding S4 domain-containing protein [Mycoplasmatota bacterium]
MRIDKYLKVSRIIKRRSVAKEIADNGRVEINDKVAKSGSTVSIGDVIKIHFGNKKVTVKVKELLNSTKKEDANLMYELISEERNA